MVWPIGKIGAPKAPCTTRKTSSHSSVSTMPQAIEAAVKPATEQIISVRQPSLAASQPVRGVATAVATRLKVSTQEIWSCVADSAPFSCGRITVTLVAVRPNSTVVNCTDSRISHCRPVMPPMPPMVWWTAQHARNLPSLRNHDLRSELEGTSMTELNKDLRDVLARVGTSTLTGVLNRRGLKSMTLFDVWPMRPEQPAMVGIAFTIPSREDKDGPTSTSRSMVQPQAMEECPPGHVLMIDSRGDSRAASAGDLYIGRLKARGAAGIVTDGGFRDTNGVFKTGLPAYHRRPSSPPSPIAHRPVDLQLPIGCGGIAVYPGDIVVGDRDAVLVIPPDLVEAVADEALRAYEYESWAELEVAKGRSLKGLFPVAGDEAKRDYEAWKKGGGKV